MKFGVVVFPGSNCDHDMLYLLDQMGIEVSEIWHKETSISDFDGIVLPGGFSYGDYLRAGAVARFSPVMSALVEFANAGGLLLGICNGFQILCEAHLLPGVLLRNANQKFICKNTYLKVVSNDTHLTRTLEMDRTYKIPIAHADGRYYCDDHTLQELIANHQILFQYADPSGEVIEESNPNGSIYNIAGICNSKKNVFGMMPHPERAADPALGNMDGLKIFESLFESIFRPEAAKSY